MTDPRPQTAYALAELLQIRMAGVSFDVLEPIATPRAVALARELDAAGAALDGAAAAALAALRRAGGPLAPDDRERVRNAIGRRLPPGAPGGAAVPEVAAYAAALGARDALLRSHDAAAREELSAAARALHAAARAVMPDYAVFVSAEIEAAAFERSPGAEWDRKRDRHLLLYLQRLAAKNETFSAFGPFAWGTVDRRATGLRLELGGGLRRHAFLERWVADAVAAAMNADPAVRAELAPRLHPAARLEPDACVRLDTAARVVLSPAARALAGRCDGRTPAHALPGAEGLAALAEAGVVVWAVECPRYVAGRVEAILDGVRGWREGGARRRWEPLLAALVEIPAAFEREPDAARRRALVQRVRATLAGLGPPGAAGAAAPQRTLYRASNPIAEECARECTLALGGDLADEVVADAAPWLDLWRDVFAFAAHRANEKLGALHASLAPGGAVPLPAFLRASEAAGLPLAGAGVPALAFLAFREVRAAFAEATAGRPDARAWRLAPDDCAFLRRRHAFPRFDPFTFPSADLQLAARSVADVEAGRHRWVLAELHLPTVALQHVFWWACPDPAAFGRMVRAVTGGPFVDWGFLPADLTNHTLLHFEGVDDLWTYAGPGAIPARWRSVRPADVEVVAAADGDVRMRAGGRDLGSFARSWVLALGFHPFILSRAPHTPRLVLGRTVVQRETWTVRRDELSRGRWDLAAPELVRDVDRLRAARGIPRHVYVRPTDEAVRRLGAGGRDKDVKPVYVDLESYPFLDVLARWMAKHGELEVTEMLPGPDELLWRDADGRRTFELRTLIGPRRG